MKTIQIFTLIFLSLSLFSCENEKAKPAQEQSIDKSINKIEVLDFYGTHRCTTCKNIEANTKYTLDNFFQEEQEKGLVSMKLINVDDDANYSVAEKYQATGTALFLNVIKDGKEKHIDLTDFAFEWGNEQVEFSMELENKIREELKQL